MSATDIADLLARRERVLGPNNPLFYDHPLHIVKGEGVWMYDADGKRYLDCYNNVPCVGHCHPHVVEAISTQAATLNTHTRYLHEGIVAYAERLLALFDASLDRVMLACTGSEANELALRVARAATGGQGIICTNATYHGNTAAVAQLSSIFKPVEGYGPNVRQVHWPDQYRPLTRPDGTPYATPEDLADAYAEEVRAAIDDFRKNGIAFAGMVLCPIFANEGLPNVPPGYLEKVVRIVHDHGGLVIADEVQAGFGRTGHMWGHEYNGFVPDLLTLGKPMGNGHPVSAVVGRGDLIDGFRKKEMYFNTFGGNPVSCAAANAVLDVLETERLVDNAARVGVYVLEGFRALQEKHDIIGDVRGAGLFFGVDLVTDRATKAPATKEARALINAMKDRGIVMGKIGEFDNLLKLRPPLPFREEHADLLLSTLDDVLATL